MKNIIKGIMNTKKEKSSQKLPMPSKASAVTVSRCWHWCCGPVWFCLPLQLLATR